MPSHRNIDIKIKKRSFLYSSNTGISPVNQKDKHPFLFDSINPINSFRQEPLRKTFNNTRKTLYWQADLVDRKYISSSPDDDKRPFSSLKNIR